MGCGQAGVRPAGWPNLDGIEYPDGLLDPCPMEGSARNGGVPRDADDNALKNRYLMPRAFHPITLGDLETSVSPAGPGGDAGPGVELTAWVKDVKYGGIRTGESCNCYSRDPACVDTHLELAESPRAASEPRGHNVAIAEVTERCRILARRGLLESNVGLDWTTDALRRVLPGHWVRLKGWMFYDAEHRNQSWNDDPGDDGGRNWRQTNWEIHPVMGIEVLSGPP